MNNEQMHSRFWQRTTQSLTNRTMMMPTAVSVDQPVLRGHMPALDGVRGLAILMVLLLHFVGLTVPTNRFESGMVLLTGYGYYGVDLFFVLSGFLITGILYDSRNSAHYFRNFYMRRILRIFPLYYAVLVALFFIIPHMQFFQGTSLDILREHQVWAWSYAVNIYNGLRGAYSLPYIDHFWSLAVEEHFYFIWPLIVWIFAARPKTLLRVSLVIGLSAVIARMMASVAHVNPLSIFVLTPFRLDALCLGGFLAVFSRQPDGVQKLKRWIVPITVVAGIFLVGTFAWNRFTDAGLDILRPVRASLFLALLAMLMLRALTASPNTLLSGIFRSKFMVFLGKYSYGIYVFHHFFSYYLYTHRVEFLLAQKLGSHFAAVILQSSVGIAASIVVAVLSYELFEKYFISLKRLWSEDKSNSSARNLHTSTTSGGRVNRHSEVENIEPVH